MKKKHLITIAMVFSLALFSGGIQGCDTGGGGGGGGDDDGGGCATPTVDITGSWDVVQDVDATGCNEGNYIEYETYTATQSGNNVTVTVSSTGAAYSGTICGNVVTATVNYPEDGGTVTENITLTFSADGNSFQGTSSWTWTDGVDSCSGTTVIDGTRT